MVGLVEQTHDDSIISEYLNVPVLMETLAHVCVQYKQSKGKEHVPEARL